MKYVYQATLIFGISFVAELIKTILPFSIPTSVYGIVILFTLLMTGIVKEEQIKETADFFLEIMPVLFIESSVGLMESLDLVKGHMLQILAVCFISTMVANIITGHMAQFVIRMRKQHKEDRK